MEDGNGVWMQERLILGLTATLAVSTALAALAVPWMATSRPMPVFPYSVSLSVSGPASVGVPVQVTVLAVGNAWIGKAPLYLSIALEPSFNVTANASASNPWGYPSVWSLNQSLASVGQRESVVFVPTTTGTFLLTAGVWAPAGTLGSVQIDAWGHVNPADVNWYGSGSLSLLVSAG